MSYIFNGTHSNYYKKKGLLKFMEFFFSFNEKSFLTKNRNSNNNNNNFVFVLLVLLLLFQVVWNSRTLKPVNKRYWKGKEKKKDYVQFPLSALIGLAPVVIWSVMVRHPHCARFFWHQQHFYPSLFLFFPSPLCCCCFFCFFPRGL